LSDKKLGLAHGYRLALFALGVGAIVTLALLAGSGWFQEYTKGNTNMYAFMLFLAAGGAISATIISALAAAISKTTSGLLAKIAGSVVSLLLGIHGAHAIAPLPINIIYLIDFAAQVIYGGAMAFVVMQCIRISGRWSRQPPFIVAGILFAVGLAGVLGQQFVTMEEFLPIVAWMRSTMLALLPWVVILVCGFYKPLRLDQKSPLNSMRLRLSSIGSIWGITLLLISGGAFITSIGHAYMYSVGGLVAKSMPLFMLSWIGAIWFAIAELLQYFGTERHKLAVSKLATSSAKRFLHRHLKDDVAWAATVGLKTTSFIVDHDPKGTLEFQIPASLQQIRGEEIQRCVSEVLGATYLHSHVVGHRIFGCIDPEVSTRPCIDALKMFSCLYLDAGPLVERRIKGLTSLLPIVDPGLAKILDLDRLNSLIRRNLWFFHFDFSWTDQHVIHTPRSTRYDVRSQTLPSKTRHAMLNYLEKKGGVGNFVWISPGARDRILQEAPVLKSVIETCPISVEDQQDEILMFIIKFEQLIPRLQRYFDFDSMRKSILDFEPSQESQRLLTLLGLQVSKATHPSQIGDALSAITSVPWRGFKEKDNALQLILQSYNNINAGLDGVELHNSSAPQHVELMSDLLNAVKMIGYPSQILHSAQLSKLALRDITNLIKAASHPTNERFHEAWLLLSSNEYKYFSSEYKKCILDFLNSLKKIKAIRKDRLAQVKGIDAIAGIGRTLEERNQIALLEEILSNTGQWLVLARADADILCLYMDTHVFLETHLQRSLELTEKTIQNLDQYLSELQASLGINHPNVIAVMSRWQDFRAQSKAA
jgi:hypothetical protein